MTSTFPYRLKFPDLYHRQRRVPGLDGVLLRRFFLNRLDGLDFFFGPGLHGYPEAAGPDTAGFGFGSDFSGLRSEILQLPDNLLPIQNRQPGANSDGVFVYAIIDIGEQGDPALPRDCFYVDSLELGNNPRPAALGWSVTRSAENHPMLLLTEQGWVENRPRH